jgi:hypothetical protein
VAYATAAELLPLLNNPGADPVRMGLVLDAAAEEIDWELGYGADTPAPTPPPALVHEVNLERAVELWKQGWSGFGIVPIPEAGAVVSARNSWSRHAATLAPLRMSRGIA